MIFNHIVKRLQHLQQISFFLLQQVWFVFTQNMLTLPEETFAHIYLMYFDFKPIPQNSKETTGAKMLSFLYKLHEKDSGTAVFLWILRKCFIEHLRVTAYVGHGVRLREMSQYCFNDLFERMLNLKDLFRSMEFIKLYLINFFFNISMYIWQTKQMLFLLFLYVPSIFKLP